MPRTLKPQKIDEILDPKTNMRLAIMLDRNDNTFFAEMNGQEVRDPTANGCKSKAWALLKAMTQLTFRKVVPAMGVL